MAGPIFRLAVVQLPRELIPPTAGHSFPPPYVHVPCTVFFNIALHWKVADSC